MSPKVHVELAYFEIRFCHSDRRRSKTMEEMSAEWNEKWTAAQESNGVTPQEYDYTK